MSAGWIDNASCQLNSCYKMTNNDHHHLHHSHSQSQSQSPITTSSKQGIAIASLLNYSDSTKIASPSSSLNINTNTANSIRRTLSSADMSSLPHSSIKRVKSSVQLQAAGSTSDDDENNKGPAFEEIWSSIQADKKSWGCILSAPKTDGSGSDSGQLPPPYVHPLEKRSASSLSEKSLGICTESLGSETGSDGFSCPPSDQEDSEEEEHEHEEEEEAQQAESEVRGAGYNVEMGIYKYNNNNRGPTSKRSTMVPPPVPVRPCSFPPPLPSLAHRDDSSNLHIRSHRQGGRLVVEAVAVPCHNFFRAQRQDGRLLLTLSSRDEDDDTGDAIEEEEESGYVVVENDDFEGEMPMGIPREQVGVINNNNVQRSAALAMTKFMELSNKSSWPRNYNATVIKSLNNNNEEVDEEEEEEADDGVSMTHSLPPRPTMSPEAATAAAVAMNAYEYYWRRTNSPNPNPNPNPNPVVAAMFKKPLTNNNNNNNNLCSPQVGKDAGRNNNKAHFAAHKRKGGEGGGALAQQDEVVLVKAAGRRGGAGEKAEYLVPLMLRGCKEPKKPSLLLWEPHCIATS